MNLIDFTTTWVKAEVLQGRIMLIIGVLVLVAAIAIFRSEHTLLRGMLIPIGLIVLILLGYGGFQVTSRPSHIDKVSQLYNEAPEKALEQELTKAQNDDKTYKTLKKVWVVLIVISALLFLVFSSLYLKGLSIGLIALFLTGLMLDSTLHYRLQIYLEQLEKLS